MEANDILKKSFSSILKEKRAEHNYTVAKAAEKCCITNKQYYNLEHGLSLPEFPTLVNIIMTFEIDFNQFIALISEQGYTALDKEK